MRYSLIIIVFILVGPQVFGQRAEIKGAVSDSATNKPIGFASISLLREMDKQSLYGIQTNVSGDFTLSSLDSGTYILRVGFVGYQTYERKGIFLKDSIKLDLGTIKLRTSSANVLKEVVVRGTTSDMQIGIDRKVFNVDQSLISQNGSVTDLLSDIPSLSVDADGTVSLRGSNSVRILIDGKPSAMAGNDITQVLQALPANAVQRIEVITNPSSKYDAEGQSGIINIVLKKNIQTGINGAVNIAGGSYKNYNGGLSLNHRDSNFNYYGNYNLRRNRMLGSGMNATRYFDSNGLIDNHSLSERSGLGHSAKLGVDYYINQMTTIGISGNFSVRDNQRNEDIFYTYQNLGDLNGTSNRISRQTEDDLGYDVNLDFKKEFKREGEELVVNVAYGRNKEDGLQQFSQIFSTGIPDERRINDTFEKGDNINVQLDYVLPFTKITKLEAGYRTSIENGEESQISREFNQDSDSFLIDYNVSNNFDLRQSVHATYFNFQSRISEKLGYQIGLRAEQANLDTKTFQFSPEKPEGIIVPGRLTYFRMYPSIFLTQSFSSTAQLQLSYSRRVNRPRGGQVNPFINVSDPLNVRQGNPDLKPEDIHALELGYSTSLVAISLTSSVYYRRINDVIQNITERVDNTNAATISRWQNISKNEVMGFELISKTNFGKEVDFTANLNIFYNRFGGSPEFNLPERDGINWNANLSTNIRITGRLSGQFRGNYDAPRELAQGRSIGNFVMDAALKLSLLKDKASLLLNTRDLLNQRRFGGFTQTDQFVRNFEDRRAFRMVFLTFNYRFGQQNRRENRNDRGENDNDEGDL